MYFRTCSYNAIPQKKGPKGSRAKVISELRKSQEHSELAQVTAKQLQSFGSPPVSPTYFRTPGLLTHEVIDACKRAFLTYLYPTMPILHEEQLNNVIADMGCSEEAYCLISSLSAFVLIQPGIVLKSCDSLNGQSGSSTNVNLGVSLLDEALRIRKCYDYFETPTTSSVMTSFFLFGCFFGLNKHNTAWFHLREATASVQLLGMQDESNYLGGDIVETSNKRRLFWLLFITERQVISFRGEKRHNRLQIFPSTLLSQTYTNLLQFRAYALQKHRPLTLHASIELPKIKDDHSISVAGFIHLVNLYLPFDDTFVGLWNKSRSDCSTFWLAKLQERLSEALPIYLNVTESQAADLKTSQHWLRTMVWQLSITNGYLSSTSPDSAMTFRYPVEIAKDLVTVTGGFSQRSMEIHGIGLVSMLKHYSYYC